MESCFNNKLPRAETIQVEDLRRDLRFDLTEIAEAQVCPLVSSHLCSPITVCSEMGVFVTVRSLYAGLQLLGQRVSTGVPPDKTFLAG